MMIPVILSGGSGTRLWPISRESHPKPYLKLPNGNSLLQETFKRACGIKDSSEIITVTNENYYLKSISEYKHQKLNLTHPVKQTFILEPCGRDTAISITLAAMYVMKTYGPDAIMLALPSDHLINDHDEFIDSCTKGYVLGKQNKIVTFGITPTYAATNYGYIECGDMQPHNSYLVSKFIEKPSLDLSQKLVQTKKFLWNSGMLCFKPKIFLDELKKVEPELILNAKNCWSRVKINAKDPLTFNFESEEFSKIKKISIDYALMEKCKNLVVLPCQFEWSDIGSWNEFKRIYSSNEADDFGNTSNCESVLVESKENYIHSHQKMVALVGVNNFHIIDTPDALLISHADHAQDIKKVVQLLKERQHSSYIHHHTVSRPWGEFSILENDKGFKVKHLVIKPGESLSLQSHQHRNEHWVIIEGVAKIVIDDEEYVLNVNDYIYITKGTRHRATNVGESDLHIIEVQTGNYFGEEDIVRYDDQYGRVPDVPNEC